MAIKYLKKSQRERERVRKRNTCFNTFSKSQRMFEFMSVIYYNIGHNNRNPFERCLLHPARHWFKIVKERKIEKILKTTFKLHGTSSIKNSRRGYPRWFNRANSVRAKVSQYHTAVPEAHQGSAMRSQMRTRGESWI